MLTARFADAEFFWDADQQQPLSERSASLARVTYQAELGSYADKVERVRQIARLIVQTLADAGEMSHGEAEHALRAIELCKCDLTTQMVKEFTELQGVVGGLYAAAQGEPEEVYQAIYDHYKPEGLEDTCPRSKVGAVVSLADKLDSVVGGFAIGQEPSGSSDPFALRRQGNGIVKVLVECALPLSLRPLVEQGMNALNVEWQKPQPEVFSSILAFLEERLKFYLETGRKIRYDTVRAVLAEDGRALWMLRAAPRLWKQFAAARIRTHCRWRPSASKTFWGNLPQRATGNRARWTREVAGGRPGAEALPGLCGSGRRGGKLCHGGQYREGSGSYRRIAAGRGPFLR